MIERVDSIYDLDAINKEHQTYLSYIGIDQKAIMELYSTINSLKSSSITQLGAATQQAAQAADTATKSYKTASDASSQYMENVKKVITTTDTLKITNDNLKTSNDNLKGSTEGVTKSYAGLTDTIKAQSSAVKANISGIEETSEAYDDLIRGIVQNKISNDELKDSQKELQEGYKAGKISLADYETALVDIRSAQQSLKTSNSDITKALNQFEKQTQSANNSLDQLRATLNLALQAFDRLSEEERSSDVGEAVAKTIQDLNIQVSQLEQSTGRFQRNVGNYTGSFVKAFEVLKDQLANLKVSLAEAGESTPGFTAMQTEIDELKNKLATLAKGSAGFEQVTNQIKELQAQLYTLGQTVPNFGQAQTQIESLENIINKLDKEFPTTRAEMRAFTNAVVEVGLAFGQTSEQTQVFSAAVGETENAVNDIKKALQFQASDTKTITGITSAVQGLTGAFSAAQGASTLLADDDDHLQKKMVQLQSMLLIVNGLQQAANALQTESGAIQLALAAKTSLLAAAQKFQNLLVFESVAAIKASVEANAELASSEEAVALTTEEAAAAISEYIAVNTEATASAIGLSTAEEEVAATTEATTAATAGLSATLLASGIGVIILAIGAAVVYLASKLPDLIQGSHLTTKEMGEMADAIGQANKAIVEQAELIGQLDGVTKRYYDNQLALAGAEGQNFYKQAALRKQQAVEEQKLAQDRVDLLGANNKEYSDLTDKVTKLQTETKSLAEIEQNALNARRKIPVKINTVGVDENAAIANDAQREYEAAQKNTELAQKRLSAIKPLYDAQTKARQDLSAARLKGDTEDMATAKFSLDEERKLTLESAKIEVDAIKDKNARILGDDRSTLAQRLAALRSNNEATKKEAEAQYQGVKTNNTSTPLEIEEADRRRKATIAKSDADTREEQRKEVETFRLRNLEAVTDYNKQLISANADVNKQIFEDDKSSLEERLAAYTHYYDAQRELINQDINLKLKSAGFSNDEVDTIKAGGDVSVKGKKITVEELLDIESKYQAKIVELNDKTGKEVNGIVTNWAKKNAEAVALANKQNNNSAVQDEYNQQLTALNDSLAKRTISIRKYNEERARLEDQFKDKSLAKQVEADQQSLQALKDNQQKIQEALKQNRLDKFAAQESGDPQQIKRANSEGESLNTASDESTAATSDAEKKLSEDRLKLTQQVSKNYIDIKKIESDTEISLAKKTYDTVSGFADDAYESQINKIQKQIDANNRLRETQTRNIKNSTLDAQQQANELIIINKTADASNEALQRKQRDEKVKEAKFDRDTSIIKIGASTAESVITLEAKAAEAAAEAAVLAADPVTAAYAPVAAASAASIQALVALTIADGALQIASVLAKPIPTYGFGTRDTHHPGGLALVGDMFVSEGIAEPGKPFRMSPAVPTLMDLAPQTRVFTPEQIQAQQYGSMAVNNKGILVSKDQMSNDSNQEVVAAIVWLGNKIETANTKQKTRLTIVNKMDNKFTQHIVTNVYK